MENSGKHSPPQDDKPRHTGTTTPRTNGIQERNGMQVITEAIRRHDGPVYAAFLDIKKAYDSVWQAGLKYKLWKFGIEGDVLNLINTFYENLTSRVFLGRSETSNPFQVMVGTAQGSVLSPLFFNIFMDGLIAKLNGTTAGLSFPGIEKQLSCGLFADDIVLLAPNPDDLQTLLDKAEEYADTWRFTFAAGAPEFKCKAMIFDGRTGKEGEEKKDDPTFNLGGKDVPVVDRYHYLGRTLGGWNSKRMLSLAVSCSIADFKNYTTVQLETLGKLRLSRNQRFIQLRLHALPKLEYALEGMNLPEDLIDRIRIVEEEAYKEFGLDLAPHDSFPKRWQRKRLNFLNEARKGDEETNWRAYFASGE
eukprot:Lithocolla_globosa_v1_NODE_132_length_5923_cov_39.615883.p4 type:complete len:362 gc:universal NODE_132_length_5923_cov_39.615883:1122-37(-)